jgi:hypothetical protein
MRNGIDLLLSHVQVSLDSVERTAIRLRELREDIERSLHRAEQDLIALKAVTEAHLRVLEASANQG